MNVTLRGRTEHFRTVTFDAKNNSVRLIEQRLLPHEFKIVPANDFRQTARAIQDMVVRGAGAIGATAAYGLAQGARAFRGRNLGTFGRHVETVYQTLQAARPTAVDPVNAMNQVTKAMAAVEETGAKALVLGGGVAANSGLRRAAEAACAEAGIQGVTFAGATGDDE